MNNPTKKIDFVAFSDLRPGHLYTDCKSILLSHWRELRAEDEGELDLFKYGCSVRVDVNGVVGKVKFFGKFPAKRVISGLVRGSKLEDILARYPALIERPSSDEGFRKFHQKDFFGHDLHLRFYEDVLSAITIENSEAVYPDKDKFDYSALYPEPRPDDQIRFKDGNFKLAIISHLMSCRQIDLGEPEDLASFVLKRFVDFQEFEEIGGYDQVPECRAYLENYPLAPEKLATIEKLCIDVGAELYGYIVPYWDGETDDFDVSSLQGAKHLPNLKKIYLSGFYKFTEEEMIYNQVLEQSGIEVIYAEL